MSDDRIVLSVPLDKPESPSSDDSNIGIRRQFRQMKARLEELELLYATRFRHQVPTSSSAVPEVHGGSRCGFHPHVIVSMKRPSVTCSTCGVTLDALDVLREYARGERAFAHTLEHLRQEHTRLSKEIDHLKRARANLRSQIKRATK